ncbi:hypothetical protein PV08_11727 [Exophiala spinifera]|uniref:Uncharacterized protein n=1 Tax=Exophiala spinifera TaxID=91928 RepID=A0A0D1Y4U9_9EURO|nr:uncharacterized protein PV08_11727 [Exophiala spinifera]KIW09951.1 hypothetical protein PV08_11727 [Exophiala spinifera]
MANNLPQKAPIFCQDPPSAEAADALIWSNWSAEDRKKWANTLLFENGGKLKTLMKEKWKLPAPEAPEVWRGSRLPVCEDVDGDGPPASPEEPWIELMDCDPLHAAFIASQRYPGKGVAVHNWADHIMSPDDHTATAHKNLQSESMLVRTTLKEHLVDVKFPRDQEDVLYSEGVFCYGLEHGSYDDKRHQFFLSFIGCAPPGVRNDPDIRSNDPVNNCILHPQRQLIADKVTWILRVAAIQGAAVVVLGAFAALEPQSTIARITKDVLLDPPAGDKWREAGIQKVILAIPDWPFLKGSFRIFEEVFSGSEHVKVANLGDLLEEIYLRPFFNTQSSP